MGDEDEDWYPEAIKEMASESVSEIVDRYLRYAAARGQGSAFDNLARELTHVVQLKIEMGRDGLAKLAHRLYDENDALVAELDRLRRGDAR